MIVKKDVVYRYTCTSVYPHRQIHKHTHGSMHPYIKALLHKGLVVKDLMDISVDQKDGIALLCQSKDEVIAEAFSRLQYTDDIDLFSMWACLILCREAELVVGSSDGVVGGVVVAVVCCCCGCCCCCCCTPAPPDPWPPEPDLVCCCYCCGVLVAVLAQVRQCRLDFIREHRPAFIAQLQDFIKAHGHAPHPATLVGLVRASVDKP